jgi:hypothetical protein
MGSKSDRKASVPHGFADPVKPDLLLEILREYHGDKYSHSGAGMDSFTKACTVFFIIFTVRA